MERQRSRVPRPAGLCLIALVTVNETGGSVRPKKQPVDVEPRVRRRDCAGVFEILVQELSPALSAKGTLQLLLDFRFVTHAVIGTRAAVSTATSCVAIARARSGGTALPIWRYFE